MQSNKMQIKINAQNQEYKQQLPIIQNYEPNTISITQKYSPKYRMIHKNQYTLFKSQQIPYITLNDEIFENNYKVHRIIDELSSCFHNRMDSHEKQLLKIMKEQINQMIKQIEEKKIEYEKQIVQNNSSEEIQILRKQVQYFKYEALTLFKQKKQLQKQNESFKHKMKELAIVNSTNQQLITKMKKKILKQQAINKKYKSQTKILYRTVKTHSPYTTNCNEQLSKNNRTTEGNSFDFQTITPNKVNPQQINKDSNILIRQHLDSLRMFENKYQNIKNDANDSSNIKLKGLQTNYKIKNKKKQYYEGQIRTQLFTQQQKL